MPSLIINYLLLGAIALIWGSQFAFTELAIASLPPLTIAAGRIFVGALTVTLLAYCFSKKENDPAQKTSLNLYLTYFIISLFEAVLPFFLVAYGQQHVDGSIAAILLGTIPIFTLLFAAIFVSGKNLNLLSIVSILCGFMGIIILIVPGLQEGWNATIIGQLAILGAAISFSISLILLKKLPTTIPPLVSVRNILLIACIPMVLLCLFIDQPWNLTFTSSSLLGIFVLGAFCAGIVYLMYMILILRTDPTFASLTNYLVPPVGVMIGVFFMDEKLEYHHILALIIIFIALIINQLPKKT
jgi:drug/metabolite transporter (DMT)-like permease